jgi:antitoxin (DNA-binding transcriptional repressor) of toxin-antitoxin stability system
VLTVTPDELAAHMTDYLHRVVAGEAIAIADHGRTVARLVAERAMPEALARAIANGSVVMPHANARRLTTAEAPPIPGGGRPAADMVSEDRR